MSADPILHRLSVADADAGARLDRALAAHLPDLSRTRIKQLIEAGGATLDGAAVRDPAAKVRAGAALTLTVPPAEAAVPEAQAIPLAVVYEDAALIVIDKPAGLVVHPAPGNPDATLVNALLAHCGEGLSGIGGVRRPGIVHRLDKDTSGLLVAAKTDRAHAALAAQFAAHSIERAYQAVVWGLPRPSRGEIEGNIGRSPANRQKMAVVGRGGKAALTRYALLRPLGAGASLVECRLATGRTHQIRVHMASMGHPVMGDPLYGRVTAARVAALGPAAGDAAAFPRQALHACVLGFIHPESGKELGFISDLPSDIRELLRILEGS